MTTTNKSRIKYDRTRAEAVELTAKRYGCSADLVRKVLSGIRQNEAIRSIYNELYKNIENAKKV